MTSSAGRDTVKYLVRCALASGDSLVKADNYGTNYTYPGMFGLATQYKTGACDVACQQAISACMLAHVNTTGANIPLYLVSSNAKIGWGTSQQYPSREGTFFGNIFTAPNAFYCLGPDFDVNVVPGRLGSNSSGSPYKNPYGTNAQCGSCTTDPAHPEAPTTCATGGVTYASPVTVYRGRIFEAENAVVYPTTAGPANITCATNGCSSGKRVGYISGDSYVQLNNVYSQSGGTMNVMLYYTNGSTNDRFYRIWLNGKQVATIGFPPTGNNDTFKSYKVVGISGFLAGSNNTLKLQGPGTTASDTNAPDLDFVEVQ
jgi:hypothetical protein